MSKQHTIDDFIGRIQTLFTENQPGAELNSKAKVLIRSMLQNLDLVTKDEFDAQCEVLLRTRNKVEALEQQLDELSQKINSTD